MLGKLDGLSLGEIDGSLEATSGRKMDGLLDNGLLGKLDGKLVGEKLLMLPFSS